MKKRVTDISFYNGDAYIHFNDEVEFDTHDERELAWLWWDFCFENKLISSFKHTIEESKEK